MKGINYPQQQIPAVLDGSLTVTRRLEGLGKINKIPGMWLPPEHIAGYIWEISSKNGIEVEIKSHYKPGETVYVKETWTHFGNNTVTEPHPIYRADYSLNANMFEWRSPITMPEWASRQKQHVVSVRCERLQEITHRDIEAEGIWVYEDPWKAKSLTTVQCRVRFARHWDKRYPAQPWNSNPWCWRIEVVNL